jgi:hypothetical protein
MALHLVLVPFLRGRRRRWGATDAEIAMGLPGDELVPDPDWVYNHAISIAAPRSEVWPWLMQIGQGRGGFYTYEGLENLVGCQIHNVTEIRPELQDLAVGEVVRMHASGFGPEVSVLEPERALVLGGAPDAAGSNSIWGFHLLDGPAGGTRLMERGRSVAGRGFAAKLGFGPYLVDPIGFVMSRRMLRTIRRLVEAQQAGPADGRR